MGKKLDALLGRTFKAAKFKAIVNLAISRLAVLKNQRQSRLRHARSDVLELLQQGHLERASLRVEHVIKDQNMLDVYDRIEGYCNLLIERIHLIEQERECPEELKEAASGLLYAASRCGDFPEIQEIRAVLNSRFGKEFAARSIELRNNCGVHPQMIQKMSTRMPSLESRIKVLKDIASENGIVLQLEETTVSVEVQSEVEMQNQHGPEKKEENISILPSGGKNEELTNSFTGGKKYKDVADAAQAAFESAAYAAAAARAALELSRSESHDPGDHDSPGPQPRKVEDGHDNVKPQLEKEILGETQQEDFNKDRDELKRSKDVIGRNSTDKLLLRVAVIGAGVAGLAAARELRREGLDVVVFEKSHHLGGTWRYDPRIDSDPVGSDPNREVVHTSLYHSLRTNLPRQLMGFLDYPFPARPDGDSRTFPGHEEVLWFLNRFADEFELRGLTRFGCEVVRVERVAGRSDSWVVESRTCESVLSREIFEAVVVCSGHFTEPRVPTIPGIEKWSGSQIHSHNYRVPEPFRDQIVVVIGFASSAFDISREVAKEAKEVHIATRSPDVKVMKLANHDNMWQHKMVKCVSEDRLVAFDDGSSVYADVILYCTGYKHHYPFLETNGIVTIEDNRVGPLYKHVFPPALAPWLSFIGIPERDIIFQMTELQCKWVARVLSGKVLLPTEKEMLADVEEYYQQMEKDGFPKHMTHYVHFKEIGYCNWLAAEAGLPPIEHWREEMYLESIKPFLLGMLENYRDEWDDAHWNAIIKNASL